MIRWTGIAVAALFPLISLCAMDPSDINWYGPMQEPASFNTDLYQIVQDPQGKLWASSYYSLYRFDSAVGHHTSPDRRGDQGIVAYCGDGFYGLPGLFVDKNGRLAMHDAYRFYSPVFDTMDSMTASGPTLPTLSDHNVRYNACQDELGNIFYLMIDDRTFEVRMWDGTVDMRVATDSMPADYYALSTILLAADTQKIVAGFGHGDTIGLWTYVRGVRTKTGSVVVENSSKNDVCAMFLMDGGLYFQIAVWDSATFLCPDYPPIYCYDGTRQFSDCFVVARLDSAGLRPVAGEYLLFGAGIMSSTPPSLYRCGSRKTVLCNPYQVFTVTPDRVSVIYLRNEYEPVPFVDNKGKLRFFVQQTQKFVDGENVSSF
jgi:hypothetical protein